VSAGSYTDSQGISVIRQHVAEFITRRDGPEFPGDPARLFLLNGATEGIKAVFYMCMDPGRACGVMIPIPQYPIYTASISEFGARKIEYYLDEEKDWAVDVGDMRRRVREARSYCQPRILAVINPGNPTGQCLAKENIREIVQLCREEGLVIIADEVYQENIYDDAIEFTSFRKVVKEMGADDVQLVSIHSVSKGYTGECGVRGGYMELLGFDNVMGEINKLFRTKLCPNTMGQVVTDAMVYPPQEGSPSYELYKEERKRTQVALRRKADLVCRRFNSVPGVSCRRVRGAMYAFPQIHLPPRAIEEAKKQSLPPDQYYCMQFLEKKGVCVVPGSGFGQKEGTWHFR
jgi:alanine transaminase